MTAGLAIAGAVCALLLIRSQDFVRAGRTEPTGGPAGVSPGVAETGTDGTSPVRSARK